MSGDSRLDNTNAVAASGVASRLAEILLASLEKLSAVGEADYACRLAGQAHVALRDSDARTARRFDVFLHRTSRRVDW